MADASTRADELAGRLEAEARALLAAVASLPADLIFWKPAADVWSVMEILCHVAEFVPYWTGQALQIARRPSEEWGRTHGDQSRVEAVERAGSRTADDVVAEIRRGVEASAGAIRGLTDADLDMEATSRNPRWGRRPSAFVVEHLIVEHVEKHLGQVRRNERQFAERRG